MGKTVQVVSDAGEITSQSPWFEEDESLESQSIGVVSVLGGQGSGKSTLLNKLFGTEFEVAQKGLIASTTTKGICAAKAADNELTLAFDVEGADARERGKNSKAFMSNCASFAAALSDMVIINMWYHDLGRLDTAPYVCLESVLKEQAKALADGENMPTMLLFAVRDTDEDASEADIKAQVVADCDEIWGKINGLGSVQDVASIDTLVLPHIRHSAETFQAKIDEYAKRFKDTTNANYYFQTKFSKGIPAEGLASYAKDMWQNVAESSPTVAAVVPKDVPMGSNSAVVVADAGYAKALELAKAKMREFSTSLDNGEKIPWFGQSCQEIVSDAVQILTDETAGYEDDPAVQRRKADLEATLETSLNALFLKQLQVLRSNAIATFKSSLNDESPTDFVFYQVDSAFRREAEESVMPGSSWSYEAEHNFLQSFMEDAANARKRLLDVQVSAAHDTQQAFRYIQMQEGRLQQIQQHQYGGVSGAWNIGAAYRPPDSNVNISVGYQQGRTNIQISMVPDEQSSLLGPNGFTSGVGPANLGLSFNINV